MNRSDIADLITALAVALVVSWLFLTDAPECSTDSECFATDTNSAPF